MLINKPSKSTPDSLTEGVDDLRNPFADFGTVLSKDRFVGRRDSLAHIEARVVRNSGNLAIVGTPRIGKSCLANHALLDRHLQLAAQRVVPVKVSLSTYASANAFFRGQIKQSWDALSNLGLGSPDVDAAAREALLPELGWESLYPRMLHFFEMVRSADLHLIIVLEEFDVARTLFANDRVLFQGIREPSQNERYRFSYVTVSRRSIRSIEEQGGAGSILALIFDHHYLRPFDVRDMSEVLERLAMTGVAVEKNIRERMMFYTGGHPLLVDQLCFHLVEESRHKAEIDLTRAGDSLGRTFRDYYKYCTDLLEEDGLYEKLQQILFGPVFDVKQDHVDELLRYGIIVVGEKGQYRGFSEHFHAYLERESRVTDLWPLWRDTERGLRRMIRSTLYEAFGEEWFEVFERKHARFGFDTGSKTTMFDRVRFASERERRLWNSWVPANPLELLQPRELFAIIFAEWRLFEPLLKHTDSYWRAHSALLSKVRNPLAHNNEERVEKWERTKAEAYCQEILQVLREADV